MLGTFDASVIKMSRTTVVKNAQWNEKSLSFVGIRSLYITTYRENNETKNQNDFCAVFIKLTIDIISNWNDNFAIPKVV